MIEILGTVKGVQLKSGLDDRDQPVHQVTIKIELSEGVERVQEVVEQMKQIVQLSIEPRQPKLH